VVRAGDIDDDHLRVERHGLQLGDGLDGHAADERGQEPVMTRTRAHDSHAAGALQVLAQ